MAAASGERAPAFTAQELEKLVDGVLPQYTLLYGPPDQQVSAHQKKDIWCAIAKEVRTLEVHQRWGTHCRKRWEDICRWSKKTAEAQLGMASQRGRGAHRTMTPLMFRILAVAYPELDGRLRASQQTQGGVWSAPATRAGSVTQSQGTASPPPVKHPKLESGRRDRVKTPGGKTTHKGPRGIAESAVTPPKVGKGQKKSAQPGVSSTAEKGGILTRRPGRHHQHRRHWSGYHRRSHCPGGHKYRHWSGDHRRIIAQEGTSIVTGQETTAGVIAQEGTSIVTGQETTAGVIAQEGTSIVTGQETTAGVIAQEGTSIVTGQETTAGVIAQEGTSIVTGQETTATAGVIAPKCTSIVTG
ncbi:hypothetical protein NDU88_003645 [Pleurodeles waltl]|uniref:Myb/SANT-like DNA-binding domain-containing protein n=1 Tax=Pleurodeles waltl TaxID=8319 RepID=A0AAV7M3Z8_PLEWA|nr:hypothetical protein NDU88_003645 [Pleurodeles waltl]